MSDVAPSPVNAEHVPSGKSKWVVSGLMVGCLVVVGIAAAAMHADKPMDELFQIVATKDAVVAWNATGNASSFRPSVTVTVSADNSDWQLVQEAKNGSTVRAVARMAASSSTADAPTLDLGWWYMDFVRPNATGSGRSNATLTIPSGAHYPAGNVGDKNAFQALVNTCFDAAGKPLDHGGLQLRVVALRMPMGEAAGTPFATSYASEARALAASQACTAGGLSYAALEQDPRFTASIASANFDVAKWDGEVAEDTHLEMSVAIANTSVAAWEAVNLTTSSAQAFRVYVTEKGAKVDSKADELDKTEFAFPKKAHGSPLEVQPLPSKAVPSGTNVGKTVASCFEKGQPVANKSLTISLADFTLALADPLPVADPIAPPMLTFDLPCDKLKARPPNATNATASIVHI